MPIDRIHIIWDNSNIFISGKKLAYEKEQNKATYFRINFKNLIDLAQANRRIEQIFCVGSIPPPTDAVWGHIESLTGKKPELYERGAASGTEQAVDQALLVRMLRLGYDYIPPETLVVLTGDGAGFELNVGFFADIKRLHTLGWRVEIMSWKHSCKSVMRNWAIENGIFVDLETYYGSITFLEERYRKSNNLDLSDRKRIILEKYGS